MNNLSASETPAPFSSLSSEWRNEGRFEGSAEGRLGGGWCLGGRHSRLAGGGGYGNSVAGKYDREHNA